MNILLLEEGETEIPARDLRVRHVRKVLKLAAGDSLRAGIVNGPAGTAVIEVLDSHLMRVRFAAEDGSATERGLSAEQGSFGSAPYGGRAGRPVDMILGHPRPIVLKRMLRDLSTVGIRRLFVVPTELGEKSYLAASMWDNVRPQLMEGAAQAGVTRLMDVSRCESLDAGIARARHDDQARVLLHPHPTSTLSEVLAADRAGAALLAIGSERGWTDGEVERLSAAGFIMAGMGNRTLRTETAAAIAGWAACAWAARAWAVTGPE